SECSRNPSRDGSTGHHPSRFDLHRRAPGNSTPFEAVELNPVHVLYQRLGQSRETICLPQRSLVSRNPAGPKLPPRLWSLLFRDSTVAFEETERNTGKTGFVTAEGCRNQRASRFPRSRHPCGVKELNRINEAANSCESLALERRDESP